MTGNMRVDAIRADVLAVAAEVSAAHGADISVHLANDPHGFPLIWLHAALPDAGAVPLVYIGGGKQAQCAYLVGRPSSEYRPRRCASEAHAMRVIRDELAITLRAVQLGMTGPEQAPAQAPRRVKHAPAPAVQPSPGPSPDSSTTQHGAEAVTDPVIRATIIAGHEVTKTTGTVWDPLHVLAMARAALAVVDARDPGSSRAAGKLGDVERVLVALLVGTMSAGGPVH